MKKNISLLIILLLTNNIYAQKSVGIRTGVNIHQVDNKNINKFNQVSWSQQVYYQQTIKERFLLEIGFNHYTTEINLSHTKNTYNTFYQRFDIKRNNVDFYALVSYRLYHTKKFSIFGGLGPGLYYSRSAIDYSIINNNEKREQAYSINDFYAPNAIIAITSNYKLTNKLSLTAQLHTVIYIPNKECSANANIGVAYHF